MHGWRRRGLGAGWAASVVAAASSPYDCSDWYETGALTIDQVTPTYTGWTQEQRDAQTEKYAEWYYGTTTLLPVLPAGLEGNAVDAASSSSSSEESTKEDEDAAAEWKRGSPYWKSAKLKYCCETASIGCATTTTATTTLPFDCVAGYSNWEKGWSPKKTLYCCEVEGLGCTSTTTTRTATSTTATTATSTTATTTEHHDCGFHGGGPGSTAAWPARKREWCCRQEGVCATTRPPFDCSGGPPAEARRSRAHREWCCRHESEGCPVAPRTTTPVPGPPAPVHPDSVLTCNLQCFGAAARHVVLPGAVGAGGGAALGDVSVEECRAACAATEDCEGVLFTNKTEGVPFKSMCYGKKAIHTSLCQPGGPFVTEIVRSQPWGKCAVFGDPHILTWDRVYGPPLTQTNPGEFWLVKSEELQVHGRFGYTQRFPTASSTTGVAVGGPLIGNHSLVVQWVGPEQGLRGFAVFWDGERILREYPSNFTSADEVLRAEHAPMDPTDFHREGRHTIGGVKGDMPSFYFRLKPDLNIYVLVGPDNCNVVIETRRVRSGVQDGYCGNFNCDARDDALDKLMMRKMADPIPKHESLFRFGLPAPEWTMKNTNPKPSVKTCDSAVRQAAEKECQQLAPALRKACVYDACAAADAAVAQDDVAVAQVATLPFSCHVGPVQWGEEESEWCCRHKGFGCRHREQQMEFKKLKKLKLYDSSATAQPTAAAAAGAPGAGAGLSGLWGLLLVLLGLAGFGVERALRRQTLPHDAQQLLDPESLDGAFVE